MTRVEIERGLADGTLERGVTVRYARGVANPPTQGTLRLPEEVDSVHPPVSGRGVVGWLAVAEVVAWMPSGVSWRSPVVGVARRDL